MSQQSIPVSADHARTRFNVFAGAFAKVPARQDDLAWDDLCAELKMLAAREAPPLSPRDPKREKESLLAFSFARLREPYNVNTNVESLTALAIDVDRCNADEIYQALGEYGLTAFTYGSPSDDTSKPNARRLRVIVQLSAPTPRAR